MSNVRIKKRRIMFICVGCILLTFLVIYWWAWKSKVIIECFFYDPCGGCFTDTGPCKPCKVEADLAHQYTEIISQHGFEKIVDLKLYNVLYEVYERTYENRLRRHNLINEEGKYPIVFIGDRYLIGEDEIRNKMVSLITEAKNPIRKIQHCIYQIYNKMLIRKKINWEIANENCIVYFFTPYCSECKQVEIYLKDLKKESFSNNNFQVISYNIDEKDNLSLLKKYLQCYQEQTNEIVVPTIFIGDRCLQGYENIKCYLKKALIEGQGIRTKIVLE